MVTGLTVGEMTAGLDRRRVVKAAAALALVPLGLGGREALAASPAFEVALAAVLGGAEASPGGMTIDAPEVAENGNMVPVALEVESPMTADEHVRELVLLSTRNPVAEIARFRLTPASGRAFVSTRIRLAESQDIVALARLSDGSLRRASRRVRVTVGGCGAA